MDYNDLKVKMFACSVIFFVGSVFYLADVTGGGDREFWHKMGIIFFFCGLITLGLGVVYALFSPSQNLPPSETPSPFWKFVALLGAIAAVITILGAIRGC